MPTIKDIIKKHNAKNDPTTEVILNLLNRNFTEEIGEAVEKAKEEVKQTLDSYQEQAFQNAEKLFAERHDKLVSDVNDYFPEFRAILDEELDKGISSAEKTIQGILTDAERKMEEYTARVENAKGPKGERGEKGDDGLPGKNGSPDTPNQVVDKVNTADKKVEIGAVGGLPEELVKIRTAIVNSKQKHGGGGGGNVVGPASSTADNIPQWSGTTGKLLKDGLPTTTWLNIDQTTPQEIINGIPLMDVEADEFTDESQVVNKRYVDSAVTQIGACFYVLDAADGTVATYKQTAMTASALATATVNSGTISSATDTLIEEWISPSTMTFSTLAAGPYDLNIYAARASGTRTCQLFWRFYERKADDSEVLIAQSATSETFTTKAHLRVYCAIDDYTPSVGSRLVGKVYVRTTGAGGTNTVVTLYYQGDEDSHWDIPADRTFLGETYVAKSGDTMEGALIAAAHESSGLTPQVTNSFYGTDATPPAGTYVEGDSYEQIEA